MDNAPITIIGAGIAGLTAAYCAHQAGCQVRVLEANDRIGGRVDSLLNALGEPLADLGPTWIWPPFQPGIARWLNTLGLSTFDQYDNGDAILDGFAEHPRRQPLPGQYGMARIIGGPGRVVQALAKPLPKSAIKTHSPVQAITKNAHGGLNLHGEHGLIGHAERVIIAAPLRLAGERIRFPDALSQDVTQALASTPTWMAAQARAVICYENAFWRDQDLSGRIASREGPLFECHDHTSAEGAPALFGFISTPPAHRNIDLLKPAILAQLERCFGPAAAQPSKIVIRDWACEPWICSEADRTEAPAHPAVGPDILRAGHLEERLWFCAAESAEQSPGLIEGALLAGETAGLAAAKASLAPA
ncbi:MAG: FAD-dependent oxidoreductase [Spiribacter sp.]|jgi:monoamine oxidase|nr:FAD-dependent oxidoreductase [Spiribacter sp.]MDR9489744.1 FAD-dependent oxidoreductase [Spiribacter sp.]